MKIITNLFLCLLTIIFLNIPAFAAPYVSLNLYYDGSYHTYTNEEVYLYIDNNKLENLVMQPIIFNDYTLVPAREVFETLGAEVTWNSDTKEVTVKYNDITIKMQINNAVAEVNGSSVQMPLVPMLINNKTMIPVRFVSENIGLEVIWDSSNRTINILSNKETEQTTQDTTVSTSETTKLGIINSIEFPDSNQNTFYIYANKKIEDYEITELQDGRIALDIYNFNTDLSENTITCYSKFISSLTIQRNETSVRLIFTPTEETFYEIFLSEDGTTLVANFGGNYIKQIEKSNDGVHDIIKITAEYEPTYEIEKDTNEDEEEYTITLTLFNVNTDYLKESDRYTSYIKEFLTEEEDNNLKITIKLNEDLNYLTLYEDGYFVLKLGADLPSIQEEEVVQEEVEWSEDSGFKIAKNSSIDIDINNIIHEDNYLEKQYILTFETDITSLIAEGQYSVDNTLVKNIAVKNEDGVTKITITSNQLIAVNIEEDSNYIYIEIVTPKDKYDNIVVIDPGHGGSDPGTSGLSLQEKDIVLDIGNKVLALAEEDGDIKIYSSRITDVYPSFDDRTSLGNEVGDMFVSIHINAPSDSSNTSPNGTEVYYLNLNTSERGINSQEMAEIFQQNICDIVGTKNRGTKTSNFKVLRDSRIPAILCEIAFITNPTDNAILGSEEGRQSIAEALYKSMKEVLEKYPK